MKIDEPKTPYEYAKDDSDDDEGDGAEGVEQERAEELDAKLLAAK